MMPLRNTSQMIKETGRTGLAKDFTPKKLFSIVGLKQATAIDLAAGRTDVFEGVV